MALTKLRSGGISDDAVVAAALATDSVGADALSSSAIASSDLPAGSVLQVVHAEKQDAINQTSSTYTDTGLEASITPSSTSNKILVMVQGNGGQSTANRSGKLRVIRGGSTEVAQTSQYTTMAKAALPFVVHVLDSPSTTSTLTYEVQTKTDGAGSMNWLNSENFGHLTLIEIAG